jgi:hypothetical protein
MHDSDTKFTKSFDQAFSAGISKATSPRAAGWYWGRRDYAS